MKIPARIILSIFIAFISFFSLVVPSASAQTTTNNSAYSETNSNADRERVFSILNGVISFTSCQLAGVDVAQRGQLCPGQTSTTEVGGAIGLVTSTMPMFYTSPASNVEYTQYLASNFGITKTTYAQEEEPIEETEGFNALSPVLNIWEAVRDLTYIIAVVFFILIGFGIMLRFKIDPRTVMTLQNQIPKIIVALVLITFSYSIAGFLVDAMWLTTYTGINVLGGAIEDGDPVAAVATRQILDNPLNYTSDILNAETDDPSSAGPLDGIRDVSVGVGSFVRANVDEIVLSFLGMKEGECSGWDYVPFIGDATDCIIKAGIAWFLGILLHAAITLIIFFAIFIALIRVWIMLLKSYIYIIIYTILGPFWILLGLLPESRFGFTNWMRAFAARLLVFPATALLLLAARIFIDSSVALQGGGTEQVDFVPPLVGNPNMLEGGGLGFLIAFGIIMLAPELLQIMMDAFKTQPFKYTPAITGGFSRGAAVPAALAGGILAAGFKRNARGEAGIVPSALRMGFQPVKKAMAPTPGSRRSQAASRVSNSWIGRGYDAVKSGVNKVNDERRKNARPNYPYYNPPQPQQTQGNNQGGGGGNQGGGQGQNTP